VAAWDQLERRARDMEELAELATWLRDEGHDVVDTVLERLLAGERVTRDGRFYRMVDAACRPVPVQARLPILIGGSGRRKTLRTAALHADLWNGYGEPERIAEISEVLRERCAEVGRDFDAIRRTVTMDVAIRDTEAAASAAHRAVERWRR